MYFIVIEKDEIKNNKILAFTRMYQYSIPQSVCHLVICSAFFSFFVHFLGVIISMCVMNLKKEESWINWLNVTQNTTKFKRGIYQAAKRKE